MLFPDTDNRKIEHICAFLVERRFYFPIYDTVSVIKQKNIFHSVLKLCADHSRYVKYFFNIQSETV